MSYRLLRVRVDQPKQIFGSFDINKCGPMKCVQAGNLCVFSRVDCKEKCLIGRIVQFAYTKGSKKERQYSSDFVDLTKKSYKNIGVFANWFQGTCDPEEQENNTVTLTPLADVFTPGYLSLEHYLSSIDNSTTIVTPNYSFSLSTNVLKKVLPRWKSKLTFD